MRLRPVVRRGPRGAMRAGRRRPETAENGCAETGCQSLRPPPPGRLPVDQLWAWIDEALAPLRGVAGPAGPGPFQVGHPDRTRMQMLVVAAEGLAGSVSRGSPWHTPGRVGRPGQRSCSTPWTTSNVSSRRVKTPGPSSWRSCSAAGAFVHRTAKTWPVLRQGAAQPPAFGLRRGGGVSRRPPHLRRPGAHGPDGGPGGHPDRRCHGVR